MSDKDLLGKADGLMRRHSAAGSDTSAFPVLTDLVDPAPSAPPIESVALPPPQAEAGAPPSQAEEIAARVMRQVDERLEAELQRVRREIAQSVAEAVRDALHGR